MKKEIIVLTKDQIDEINKSLSSGSRVEIIPTKDGARIVKILRKNLRIKPS